MATDTKRTKRLNVRLSEDIVNRLDAISDQLGLAASTVASYAIGEYVNTKESQRKSQSVATSMMVKQMASSFTSPEFIAQLMAAAEKEATEEKIELAIAASTAENSKDLITNKSKLSDAILAQHT
mgnify:CR=1 FL=1